MRIVGISDTHNRLSKIPVLPDGDVLVHAGDLTGHGEKWEMERELELLGKYQHKHKIFTCGNHDFLGEKDPELTRKLCIDNGIIYLCNEFVVIDGVKFYGSPVTPWFHNWAFNVQRGEAIKKYWDNIPKDTRVLITHGPPYGILDEVFNFAGDSYNPKRLIGCEELMKAVREVKPEIHIFGHDHGCHGEMHAYGTSFYNSSICDERYVPCQSPHVIDI